MEEAVLVAFRALLECFMGIGIYLAALGFYPQNHKIKYTLPKTKLKRHSICWNIY